MSASDPILRHGSDPDGLDFAALRAQGIELVQQLCGKQWTDYNLHDPGVTLLEALCYSLTDLAYRTGLPLPDYFIAASGAIDYGKLPFLAPQAILPCRPLTIEDYGKFFYDAVPEIAQIWLDMTELAAQENKNYLSIYILAHPAPGKMHERDDAKAAAAVADKVKELFHGQRNLCQDLACIKVISTQPYYLGGKIEIEESASAAQIYAQIYHECANFIACAGAITPYNAALAEGKSWSQLLTGPLTTKGYVADHDFAPRSYKVFLSQIITLIRRIHGVTSVVDLYFIHAQDNPATELLCDPRRDNFPVLQLPAVDEMAKLNISHVPNFTRGTGAYIDFATEVKLVLAALEMKDRVFRVGESTIDMTPLLPDAPGGRLNDYVGIANELPDGYGISRYGVAASAGPEVRAKARQLKGYLYPFEQLMANYLQCLTDMPNLYALDSFQKDAVQTYFSQYLQDREIPGIEEVYIDEAKPPKQGGEKVAAILARYDQSSERRNQLLNSLLAMYGESFFSEALFSEKTGYLKGIANFTRNRGAGMDCTKADGESALQAKLRLIPGLDADKLVIIEHLLLRPRGAPPAQPAQPEYVSAPACLYLVVHEPATEATPAMTPEYKNWLKDRVVRQIPAHVLPVFYWLNEKDWGKFDNKYKAWLGALKTYSSATGAGTAATPLNSAAQALLDLLKLHQADNGDNFF